jgi:iron complex transport system substrate-binding protein
MRNGVKLLGVLALGAMVLAAACGGTSSGDKTKTAAAGGATKPAGTQAANTTPAASAAAASPAAATTTYPLTVTDMLGRSVTIAKKPIAVAAISPTTVEYVYAVGATSKTRTSSVRFPLPATGAKDIGPSYQPNLELIAAEKPDLVVADSVSQPQLKATLEGLNVPVLFVGAQVFSDVPKGLRLMGQVLDQQATAGTVAAKLEKTLSDLQAKTHTTKPKVLVVNGTPDDFFAAKPESYVGDLVQLLGGDNVAKGAPDVGRFPGYTKLSLETILASKPDVILAITAGPPSDKNISAALAANPAWADVPAVKNKRVTEVNVEIFLQAPGPRAGDGLNVLEKLLYP